MKPKVFAAAATMLHGATGFAQAAAPAAAAASSPLASDIDAYVKIAGAIIAAVAGLLGLPAVLLSYKKTRAEISKLELEARALRDKEQPGGLRPAQSAAADPAGGGTSILVSESPGTTVHVLADPRLLAPLLILLDFVFASVILTVASHLLNFFTFSLIREAGLLILAVILLVPIARQILRVRTALVGGVSESHQSVRQVRIAAYTVYAIVLLSAMVIGAVLLFDSPSGGGSQRYFAWALLAWSAILILAIPVARPRLERYLASLQEGDGPAPPASA